MLLLVAIAVLLGVNWNRIATAGDRQSGDEELELAQELARTFGDQPDVEFVCSLPVVGEAPCVPGEVVGNREVRLVFTSYEPPTGVDPQEHARQIAVVAFATSRFVRESDKTEVIFHEGDESASVTRKYSFAAGEMTTDGVTVEN